jgi:hypothetical protein
MKPVTASETSVNFCRTTSLKPVTLNACFHILSVPPPIRMSWDSLFIYLPSSSKKLEFLFGLEGTELLMRPATSSSRRPGVDDVRKAFFTFVHLEARRWAGGDVPALEDSGRGNGAWTSTTGRNHGGVQLNYVQAVLALRTSALLNFTHT